MVETPKNEILLAPYDAKNIYMMQLHNVNQKCTVWNFFWLYFVDYSQGKFWDLLTMILIRIHIF